MDHPQANSRFPLLRLTGALGALLAAMIFFLPRPATAQEWQLSWSEEFNALPGTAFDSTKWAFDKGVLTVNGIFNPNSELQFYCPPTDLGAPLDGDFCDPQNPNAFLDGSHLAIQPRLTPGGWTSARLKTKGLLDAQYGRIEASIQVPSHAGLAPAFSLLGTDLLNVGQRAAGEMDPMQNWTSIGPAGNRESLRGDGYSGGVGADGITFEPSINFQYTFPEGERVDTAFHLYGIIWSPKMVQFYVDDPSNVVFVRTAGDIPQGTSWPFNNPFYLVLNMAVGGTVAGAPDSGTATAGPMLVDYVRYYQAQPVPGPQMTADSISVKAGQTGSTQINLNSINGSGLMYLDCSGAPLYSTCSIASGNALNHAAVDFSTSSTAVATLRVATSSPASAALTGSGGEVKWAAGLSLGVFAVALFPLAKGRRSLPWKPGLALLGVLFAALIAQGCGGGSLSGNSRLVAPGNYTLTVTAYTVSGNSSTVTVPLKVN